VPHGIAPLDHVVIIMMENHGYAEVTGNPNMPFLNAFAKKSASASNYYAVAHPSLTNYLEVVGGSNFGVLNDHSPDWHNGACQTNLATGQPSLDTGAYANICPIAGSGTDAATPAVDLSNFECNDAGPCFNVDGSVSLAAASTVGKTIAHQLVATGRTPKAYEENLPPTGADGVNSADGYWSNLNPPSSVGITDGVLGLYAGRHNPFAYFVDIQSGGNPHLSLNRIVDFDSPTGLFADLASGNVPSYSYIVSNQCNDQHGRSGAGPACDYDPNNTGTLTGLNPALVFAGDPAIERIVTGIKASPAWKSGRNAIVIVWDESDYANAPITNQVTLVVQTNDGGSSGVVSNRFYTYFSLLKSIEAGFGLPCLNHACDSNVAVMTDLFN